MFGKFIGKFLRFGALNSAKALSFVGKQLIKSNDQSKPRSISEILQGKN